VRNIRPKDFDALVSEAIEGIPDALRPYLERVVIDVEEVPDRATLREMEIDDPRDLLGLYVGRPITERSVDELASFPDRIVLYRANILRMCRTTAEVVSEVRATVLHEIGHHFGLSEDDLDALGYG
jgi:predicted Zn-dependent protease with MMP-like domain